MSEYPIGLNGEMIHCLAKDEYSIFCRSKLEKELNDEPDIDSYIEEMERLTNKQEDQILFRGEE